MMYWLDNLHEELGEKAKKTKQKNMFFSVNGLKKYLAHSFILKDLDSYTKKYTI